MVESGPRNDPGRKGPEGRDERDSTHPDEESASSHSTGSPPTEPEGTDSLDAEDAESPDARLSPDGAMAASQYNLPDPPADPPPTRGGSRLGETAFIGCLYVVVGFVALALALIFGQIIWRMFFM